jgi:hypothetical protein
MPFHYGYWDDPGRPRAANELTLFECDPVSKQPHLKYAAVKPEKATGAPLPQPDESGRKDAITEGEAKRESRPHLADCIGLLLANEERLVRGWDKLRDTHSATPDIGPQSRLFALWSRRNAAAIEPYVGRYGAPGEDKPAVLDRALPVTRPQTGFGLLRDLQDLWLMANESTISIAALIQGARALRDWTLEQDLLVVEGRNARQRAWLSARIEQAAPQILSVPS